MLGGGTFVTQNKVLPGTYINFVSLAGASYSLSERGIVAAPLQLSWGPEQTIFEVTSEEFQKQAKEIFGYSYDSPKLWMLRELFSHAQKGYFYRLNKGMKAANTYAEARYSGVFGNEITIVVAANVDDETKTDVKTFVSGKEMEIQTVAAISELKDNPYVVFKKEEETWEKTVGMPLTGGEDGAEVTGEEHSAFLSAIEPFRFHILCCPSEDDTTKKLYTAFTKRLRDENGVKFQTVLYKGNAADYEGVISVENEVLEAEKAAGLVYWLSGMEAACAVQESCENRVYDGELTVDTGYTQDELADGCKTGKLMFHKNGDEVCILMDINTLQTFTEEKGEDFSNNQTIRVLDQIGTDIASVFNSRYSGKVPNDESGRISLWNDVTKCFKLLERVRAIEPVDVSTVTVERGENKRAVVINAPVTPISCMSHLYMTIVVG